MTFTIRFGPGIRFRTYFKAFFGDILTGMNRPLSVRVALLALYVSNRMLKIVFACLAVVGAVFASYHQCLLPIQMDFLLRGSTAWRKVTGSKSFQI